MNEKDDSKDLWVFTEIKDHERVDECALEILGKARDIADKLDQKLVSIVLALDAEQYLSTIKDHGVDKIIYFSHQDLKHYHERIFTKLIHKLVEKYTPSIFLFPSTEAGNALAARVAYKCRTGLVSDVLNLELDDEYGNNLLLTDKPAYGGNIHVKITCPSKRPQMCTITRGTFNKRKIRKSTINIVKEKYEFERNELKIKILGAPTRKDKPSSTLSDAEFVIGGGQGLGSKDNFEKLYDLAKYTKGKLGGTRRPILNGWMPEHLQIGISGESIKPKLYISFGISGAIQHITGITDSNIIISINTDPNASIFKTSDYCIVADANEILNELLEYYKIEE
ncbi:MAG: electron transfer flavoprotein subunit alpha [Candidatus Lokiarchaeota archaeon]|nr:electron transfer flavoprotein subunit alpha [Candidatus Lokiarchaeota archaeon]MBD3201587.1 electron transfer flavoprotein subunit alpha [Candidatus Lokiarchaeota archaeon]